MVYITSISMKGFKSFNVKTSVKLSKKLTSVVGPNGSGKSNILDAVCFVLGRLAFSSMRASKGTDLIYSPRGKKGAEYAEVKMFLNNSEHLLGEDDQISVSRRVHRDGQSVYRINGRRSTRTKVLDLFAQALVFPDGHNVVQQGDIIGFIKRSSEERRKEIDAIAGIESYEEKKRKAKNELDGVMQKISQVSLLMGERQRRLQRLEKERSRAKAYKDLLDRRTQIEASILAKRITEREKFIADFEKQLSSRQKELEKANKTITESEEKIEKLTLTISKLDERLVSGELKGKLDSARELEQLRQSVKNKADEVEVTKADLERAKSRIDQLIKSKADLEVAVTRAQKELENLKTQKESEEANLASLEAERKSILAVVDGARKKREVFEAERKKLSKTLDDYKDQKRELLRQLDKQKDIAFQRESERERSVKRLSEMENSRKSEFEVRRKNENRLREVDNELKELNQTRTRVASRLEAVLSKSDELEPAIRKLEDRHLALQAKDGVTAAANELMNKKDTFGIIGRVSELFTASESDLPIIRSAAGPNLNAFVVKDLNGAKAAIAFLYKEHLGRARFIPLSQNSSPLLSLVKCDSVNKGAIATALGNFEVGEIGEGKITRNGTLMKGGVIIGGHDEYDTREIDTLKNEFAEITSEKFALESESSEISSSIRELELERASLESSLSSNAFDTKLATDLERTIKRLERERDAALSSQDKISKELPALDKKIEVLISRISTLKDPGSVDFVALSELDDRLKKARLRLNDIKLTFNTTEGRLKNVILPDQKQTETVLKDTEVTKSKLAKKLPVITKEFETLEKKLTREETAMEKIALEVEGLRARHTEASIKLAENREEKARAEGSIGRLQVEVVDFSSQIDMQKKELDGLNEDFSKYGEIEILPGSLVKLQDGLSKVERRIVTFGAVNMTAQSEFEEAEGRVAEIQEKAAELDSERASIEDFISQVEERKREAFMENFNKISKYFSEIFFQLAGGPGELILENKENPFEGGLIIQASPRGKDVLRMESMSGGEKTLIALAFVFSIQQYKPAPFYVFDEVEAALDKKNSEKVAALLDKMSNNAQIITITHNDAVMRVSDQLIGVSMTKNGVSRLVSADPKKLLSRQKS